MLELLQLHHGCDLSIPVQLHISFELNRFITRYNAISSELKAQDERRTSIVPVAGKADDGAESVYDEHEGAQGEGGNEEYQDEGGEDEEIPDKRSEAGDTIKRRRAEESVKDSVRDQRERGRGADGELPPRRQPHCTDLP